MLRKKALILIGFIVLSMFLFIQPTRALLDYDHRREYDLLFSGRSSTSSLIYLYKGEVLHWEFTTILDDIKIEVKIIQPIDHPDPDIVWIVSENKTADYGIFTAPEYSSYWFVFRNMNYPNKSGYIMIDFYIDSPPSDNREPMWDYYRLPLEHPESTWEWQSLNNHVEQYYGLYCNFFADEYDHFLTAYQSYNPHEIMTAMFMDEGNFERWVEEGIIYNNHISQVFFSGQIQTFRPAHNDTWYFVFVSTLGETYLNVSVRYTQDYYEEPEPEPELEPEPDPEPDPIPTQDFTTIGIVLIVSSVGVIILLGFIGRKYYLKRQKNDI